MKIGDYILLYQKNHYWLGQIVSFYPSPRFLESYRAITQGFDHRVGDTYAVLSDWIVDSGTDLLTKYPELLI